MNFEQLLKKKYNIKPEIYFNIALNRLEEVYNEVLTPGDNIAPFDPLLLKFSDNKINKLEYDGIPFGSINHKDFIIYYLLYGANVANKKRNNYWARMFSNKNNITFKKFLTLAIW